MLDCARWILPFSSRIFREKSFCISARDFSVDGSFEALASWFEGWDGYMLLMAMAYVRAMCEAIAC